MERTSRVETIINKIDAICCLKDVVLTVKYLPVNTEWKAVYAKDGAVIGACSSTDLKELLETACKELSEYFY